MWWVPLAMAGTSMLGAGMQSSANRDATRAQMGANRDALNFQRNAAISGLTQTHPVYKGQVNALNRLYGMQGMPRIEAAQLNALLQPFQNMEFGGGGGGGGRKKGIDRYSLVSSVENLFG